MFSVHDFSCIAVFLPRHSQSMVFITILLFAVAYIFAIVGVVFFESYAIPDRPDLTYHHSFRYCCSLQHACCVETLRGEKT